MMECYVCGKRYTHLNGIVFGVPEGDVEEYREIKKQLVDKYGVDKVNVCVLCLLSALGVKKKKQKKKG